MSRHDNIGDRLKWRWGANRGRGVVKERFTDRISRTIKGSRVTREATDDNPAYLLEQEDGDRVLKSHSELSKA